MLNQKDNDFDDLFRRASDRYPLRTDSADWGRMADALDNPSPDLPGEGGDTDKRRKRRFIWFFLLLPIGGAGYYIMHQAGNGWGHHGNTAGVSQEQHAPVAPAGAGSQQGVKGADQAIVGAGADQPGVVKGGQAVAGADQPGVLKGADQPGAANGTQPDVVKGAPGNGAEGDRFDAARKGSQGGLNRKSAPGNKGIAGKGAGEDGGAPGGNEDRGITSGSEVVGGAGAGRDADKVGGSGVVPGSGAGNSRVANYPVNRAGTRQDYNLTVNVEAPPISKDSGKTKPKASSKQKSSFLYAGLLAAPDLSTVKFQRMKGVGTTFSLLLGYQFNKKWAVETGVSVDRKRYYTDAEYFNTSKLPPGTIPSNWALKYLDGTCYMWEIPINVRYNFSEDKKSKWFATAGLSTYLMTRENYNYNYDWWTSNAYGNATENWDWKKPSQYWFSIINLSVGYEHRLGRIGNLRIEPYLRVPLSGLGTGSLNIQSAGLNIGITRRLW